MDHSQLRQMLHSRIELADEPLLRKIAASTDELSGIYSADEQVHSGEPAPTALREPRVGELLYQDLVSELDQAQRDHENGDYVDLESFVAEGESW